MYYIYNITLVDRFYWKAEIMLCSSLYIPKNLVQETEQNEYSINMSGMT